MKQHAAVAANPYPAVGVAPIPAPSYLGGAAILVGMIGMLAVAAQAAGLKEKQVTSKMKYRIKQFGHHLVQLHSSN